MLDTSDLRVELAGEAGIVRAVDGLSLAMARGETFALVGESGCGKSMTALALLRLLPDNGAVTGGDVRWDGVDLLDLPEAQMRAVRGRRIGMIFQEPGTSLNPVMRVGDQIVEAIEAHTPLRGAAARERAVQWLVRVGIDDAPRRLAEYPFRLSGGQKQRVMIAMTLAAEPDLLIADEPTTALDVTIQAQILDLLRDLQAERRLAVLLITHDLAVVSTMAQRVALMYAGQIVEVAEAAEFFRAPRHPYASALLRALPDAARREQRLEAIPGSVPPLTQAFAGCRFAPRCRRALAHCAGTPPELLAVGPRHAVRCWLHAPGAPAPLPATAAPVGPLVRPGPVSPVTSAGRPAGRTPADARPLLSVRHLSVRFALRRGILQRPQAFFTAVDDVGFDLHAGQTLGLVGESGCGKTTLGKAIVQLLRGRARVGGEVRLDGVDLLRADGATLRAARRRVQIIFQDPFASLNPRLRVADLLDEGLAALQPELDADMRRRRIATVIERVGLRTDALSRYPHEFSGGQRQRIAIARALAVEPALIVCDEPTSALDVSVQAQILNLLRELQSDLNVSYLFITHNIGVIDVIADRVAVMRAGRLVEQGARDNVLRRPMQPYTQALLAAVPRLVHPA